MPKLYHNTWHKRRWFIGCNAFCVTAVTLWCDSCNACTAADRMNLAPRWGHENLCAVPWRTRKGQIKASMRKCFVEVSGGGGAAGVGVEIKKGSTRRLLPPDAPHSKTEFYRLCSGNDPVNRKGRGG